MKFCTAVCYNPCLVLVKPRALSVHGKARSHNAASTLQDRLRGTDLGCLYHTAQGRVAARLTAERLLRQRSERRARVGTADWRLAGSAGSLLGNRSVQPCR